MCGSFDAHKRTPFSLSEGKPKSPPPQSKPPGSATVTRWPAHNCPPGQLNIVNINNSDEGRAELCMLSYVCIAARSTQQVLPLPSLPLLMHPLSLSAAEGSPGCCSSECLLLLQTIVCACHLQWGKLANTGNAHARKYVMPPNNGRGRSRRFWTSMRTRWTPRTRSGGASTSARRPIGRAWRGSSGRSCRARRGSIGQQQSLPAIPHRLTVPVYLNLRVPSGLECPNPPLTHCPRLK